MTRFSRDKPPRLLRTPREYRTAIQEIDRLLDLDPKPGSQAAESLEHLSVLVEAYEDRHSPTDDSRSTPQSVATFMLEQRGMTRAQLSPLMGGKARVSAFFSGKSRLSMEQIRSLRDALGIPADLLID